MRLTMVVASAEAVIMILLGAGFTLAQQKPLTPPDPQSAFEPRSAPGAGQKFLKRFVGRWDVEKAFYPRSGDPVRSKGKCVQTMMHGDRFLKSEFSFERKGSTETGTGIIGFDTNTG